MNWNQAKAQSYFERQSTSFDPADLKYKSPQVEYHRIKFDTDSALKALYERCELGCGSKEILLATLTTAQEETYIIPEVYNGERYIQMYRKKANELYTQIFSNTLNFEKE